MTTFPVWFVVFPFVVHEIVQTLGGDVQVTSELGRGTTFTVRLPLARPPATAATATTAALSSR